MKKRRADVGEIPNCRMKLSGDAFVIIRARSPMSPRKRTSMPQENAEFGVRRAIGSLSSEQLNHTHPWKDFVDTSKLSTTKSTQEVGSRTPSNVDRFHAVIFVAILASCVMSSVQAVVSAGTAWVAC
ncbi:hypothetical protein HPB52_009963 [Rhipicephalus sanguineus]|uniref:Uncharacterized protein n=1 Tax=Rhipicephalus sanguineus TaxID=34632 RepID=A0A9D4Q079_RHISA|nr:hypothetical protein HPB52_009963 [Rhipicephalus sanguineus]